jgi:hypothetical protein
MLPAQQGLEAAQAAAIEMELGLIDQHEVIVLDGVTPPAHSGWHHRSQGCAQWPDDGSHR